MDRDVFFDRLKKRGLLRACVISVVLSLLGGVMGGFFPKGMDVVYASVTSNAMGTNGYVAGGTTIKAFSASSGISVNTSATSVTEGASVDLSSFITGVTYTGGTNAGKSASYTVTTNYGTISGTTWTVTTNKIISTAQTATLTITESGSGSSFSTTKTITVNPRPADHITVEMNNGKPEVSNGSPIDLANEIKVINAYDGSTTIDGQFTYNSGKYTLSVPSGKGSISGTTYTPANITSAQDVTVGRFVELYFRVITQLRKKTQKTGTLFLKISQISPDGDFPFPLKS